MDALRKATARTSLHAMPLRHCEINVHRCVDMPNVPHQQAWVELIGPKGVYSADVSGVGSRRHIPFYRAVELTVSGWWWWLRWLGGGPEQYCSVILAVGNFTLRVRSLARRC